MLGYILELLVTGLLGGLGGLSLLILVTSLVAGLRSIWRNEPDSLRRFLEDERPAAINNFNNDQAAKRFPPFDLSRDCPYCGCPGPHLLSEPAAYTRRASYGSWNITGQAMRRQCLGCGKAWRELIGEETRELSPSRPAQEVIMSAFNSEAVRSVRQQWGVSHLPGYPPPTLDSYTLAPIPPRDFNAEWWTTHNPDLVHLAGSYLFPGGPERWTEGVLTMAAQYCHDRYWRNRP